MAAGCYPDGLGQRRGPERLSVEGHAGARGRALDPQASQLRLQLHDRPARLGDQVGRGFGGLRQELLEGAQRIHGSTEIAFSLTDVELELRARVDAVGGLKLLQGAGEIATIEQGGALL